MALPLYLLCMLVKMQQSLWLTAAQSPMDLLEVAVEMWSSEDPNILAYNALPFSLTLAGVSWLVLRGAGAGVFSNVTTISLGGVTCSLLAVTWDGGWALSTDTATKPDMRSCLCARLWIRASSFNQRERYAWR